MTRIQEEGRTERPRNPGARWGLFQPQQRSTAGKSLEGPSTIAGYESLCVT